MSTIVFSIVLFLIGISLIWVPIPQEFSNWRKYPVLFFIVFSTLVLGRGALAYNDAGMCVHIRTAFGVESSKCDIGWYAVQWGTSTEYPHYITISHTKEPTENSVSDLPPMTIRMSDNWTGEVTQTTRFGIPQDEEQFLKMARDYRSPERLIVTLLRPAVVSSLDSVANLYSMEEYWSGGKRDEFKTEFELAVQKGRPAIDRNEIVVNGPINDQVTSPSDSEVLDDTAETGTGQRIRVETKKRLDENGNEIRIPHDYLDYGIHAPSAIVEQLDPDDQFEERTMARKEAASRRIIAREQRLEQEEQRLLAITKSERDIAERQGQARVEQIEQTTNAETEKRLALVVAERIREEARIAQQTSQINLDKAKIDAQAVQVTADADAYARERLLEADNALQMKLTAEVDIQKVWADAYARRNVPSIVMAGTNSSGTTVGADSEVRDLLNLLTVDTAKRLAYDRSVQKSE